MRISEALALRHGVVDFTASINGTLVYIAHQSLSRQPWPKHDGHVRTVRLTENGIEMVAFRAARDLCAPAEREADMPLLRRIETRGVAHPWINPAVVTHHFGAVRMRPDVLSALDDTGLTPAQLTPPALRRSVATAVTREVGLEHASELLGRSDTRITKRSYVAPTARSVAAEAIDELFG